jgi:hypothetical protein
LAAAPVLLRETRGALRTDLVHQLFVKSQMRIGDDGGPDRPGVGFADLASDPFAYRVDPLRRINAGLFDFGS